MKKIAATSNLLSTAKAITQALNDKVSAPACELHAYLLRLHADKGFLYGNEVTLTANGADFLTELVNAGLVDVREITDRPDLFIVASQKFMTAEDRLSLPGIAPIATPKEIQNMPKTTTSAKKTPAKKAPAKKKAGKKVAEPKVLTNPERGHAGRGSSAASGPIPAGLGIEASWVAVFTANTKSAKKNRLTDVQISDAIKAAFPGRETAAFNNANGTRKKYNAGKLATQGGEAPTGNRVSSPFDADGNVIEGSVTVSKQLTAAERTPVKAQPAKKAPVTKGAKKKIGKKVS